MKIFYVLLSLFALTFASFAAGNAVVDYADVVSKSKANASFEKQVTDIKKEIDTSFERERKVLEDLYKEVTEKRDTFSPKELAKKEEDFQKRYADFQKRFEDKNAALRKSMEEANTTLLKALSKAVADIAKDRSYDMVYNSAALAYYPPAIDISNDVLRKLNEVISSVTIKKP